MELDEFSINDALELYFEKHSLLKTGDVPKLRELKKKHPEIFDKKWDLEMRELILYVKTFQKSKRYKELKKENLKKKLIVITTNK